MNIKRFSFIFLLLTAFQSKAQSDSSQFAMIHFTDGDLNLGIIHLVWNDGTEENLAKTLQIEKPLKTYRENAPKMEMSLLQYMETKGYDLVAFNSYSYGSSTSKWIFRKRKQFKVY